MDDSTDNGMELETSLVNENEQPAIIDPVGVIAQMIFDCTKVLHNLDDHDRGILATAATLHRHPLPWPKKKPIQAIENFIQEQVGDDLDAEDKAVLAAVLAADQGHVQHKKSDRFGLSPAQQRQALAIEALLRIAAALVKAGYENPGLIGVQMQDGCLWLVLEGLEQEVDLDGIRRSTRLWERIGYPAVEVMPADEAVIRLAPFPEPTETIGIRPDDPLSEAARKVMRFHFARMIANEEGTRMGKDIEALHDMRVATRRMRAAFEVFADAFERGALKPHLKGLRATGRALGKVRDLDVFMEKAHHYLNTLPPSDDTRHSLQSGSSESLPENGSGVEAQNPTHSLAPLLSAWQAQRESARQEMLAFLDSNEYADFKRQFNIFLNTPGAGARPIPAGLPTPFRVRELAPALIYERLASVRAYGPALRGAPVETLHALRIEFKKLRYTVEYFEEVLGKRAIDVVNTLKGMQDYLGDLNDAEVASLLLRDFLFNWQASEAVSSNSVPESLAGVAVYLADRETERQRLQMGFVSFWKQNFALTRFRRNIAQAVAVL